MNGTVVFTKDFLDKTKEKKISRKRIGELRMRNIYEADKEGRLSQAKNRIQLGQMAGITDIKKATMWANRKINAGIIKETLLGFGKDRRPEYEYHCFENKVVRPKTDVNSKALSPVTEHGNKTTIQPTLEPKAKPNELNIPLNSDILKQGFSLTLNINFTFNKEN